MNESSSQRVIRCQRRKLVFLVSCRNLPNVVCVCYAKRDIDGITIPSVSLSHFDIVSKRLDEYDNVISQFSLSLLSLFLVIQHYLMLLRNSDVLMHSSLNKIQYCYNSDRSTNTKSCDLISDGPFNDSDDH